MVAVDTVRIFLQRRVEEAEPEVATKCTDHGDLSAVAHKAGVSPLDGLRNSFVQTDAAEVSESALSLSR
jgi:hypothetical protein